MIYQSQYANSQYNTSSAAIHSHINRLHKKNQQHEFSNQTPYFNSLSHQELRALPVAPSWKFEGLQPDQF